MKKKLYIKLILKQMLSVLAICVFIYLALYSEVERPAKDAKYNPNTKEFIETRNRPNGDVVKTIGKKDKYGLWDGNVTEEVYRNNKLSSIYESYYDHGFIHGKTKYTLYTYWGSLLKSGYFCFFMGIPIPCADKKSAKNNADNYYQQKLEDNALVT